MEQKIKDFFLKEWLFWFSLVTFFILFALTRRIPVITPDEWQILFLLYMFFIAIKAIEKSGFLRFVAWKIEQGEKIGIKLLLATYLLSTFFTNDVALLAIVPLTLSLDIKNKSSIIALEAIASNAASLLPYSTPQNLYIYWHYQVLLLEFTEVIAPFSLFFLFAIFFLPVSLNVVPRKERIDYVKREAYPGLFLFLLVVLVILKILPLFSAFVVFFYYLFMDKDALKIDYYLLATFLLFFAISDELAFLLHDFFIHSHHLFFSSLILSQLISNVPATLVMANFTDDWKSLLWGVDVGGFGLLWGSLANLIAYKLYQRSERKPFLLKFLAYNFAALTVGILLFEVSQWIGLL